MKKEKIKKLAAKETAIYCPELNQTFNWGPAPGARIARALLGKPKDLTEWWRGQSGGQAINAPVIIREEYSAAIRKLKPRDGDLFPFPTYVAGNKEVSIQQLSLTEIKKRLSTL